MAYTTWSLSLVKLTYFILVATYSVYSQVSLKAMAHGIQHTSCVWVVALRLLHSVNTMYSLTPSMIIWMIYGVSLAVSHTNASWRHMVGTHYFFLLGLQARKSGHKEFRFLLVAIKCLSAFLFYIMYHQPRAIERIVPMPYSPVSHRRRLSLWGRRGVEWSWTARYLIW